MSQILERLNQKVLKVLSTEKRSTILMSDGVEYMVALTHEQILKGSEEGVLLSHCT